MVIRVGTVTRVCLLYLKLCPLILSSWTRVVCVSTCCARTAITNAQGLVRPFIARRGAQPPPARLSQRVLTVRSCTARNVLKSVRAVHWSAMGAISGGGGLWRNSKSRHAVASASEWCVRAAASAFPVQVVLLSDGRRVCRAPILRPLPRKKKAERKG